METERLSGLFANLRCLPLQSTVVYTLNILRGAIGLPPAYQSGGKSDTIPRRQLMRRDLLTRIVEQEVHVGIDEGVVVNLHLVNQTGEQPGWRPLKIDPSNQKRDRIPNELLTRFAVLGRRAIDIDELAPARLIDSDNLVPTAVIDAGGRDRCFRGCDLPGSRPSLDESRFVVREESHAIDIQTIPVPGVSRLFTQ